MPRIHRVTMFKISHALDQARMVDALEELGRTQQKDGAPYVLNFSRGVMKDDGPRAQGYTVVTKSEFKSADDLEFFDKECPAHAACKEKAKRLRMEGPPLTTYFEEK